MADYSFRRWQPDPAKVLSAYAKASNSTTAVNVLTVPAGRTWTGSVTVMASSQSPSAILETTRAVTAGTGVLPTAGTIIGVAQCDRDTTTTAITIPDVVVAAPAGNSVTIDVVNSTATTYIGGVSCFGYLD